MTNVKKIAIIDDSAIMRRILSDIISREYINSNILTARNGLEGIKLIEQEHPNIIFLDIHMPIMNGIEVLEQLKQKKIRIPVIVVSSLAQEGNHETIKALELGAFDFITKPSNIFDIKHELYIKTLKEKLKLATESSGKKVTQQKTIIKREPIKISTSMSNKQIIALGCSTGGPKALHKIIPKLPSDLAASILIVQHMPPGFTHSLSERLNEISELNVKEAENDEIISKGTVYIAKGGLQMRVSKDVQGKHLIKLTDEEPYNSHKPSVNIMMESLINTNYEQIFGIILTGMGADGTEGLKHLRTYKKMHIMAQDEESCVVYGMPRSIVEAGLADEIVSLNNFSDAIINKVGVL